MGPELNHISDIDFSLSKISSQLNVFFNPPPTLVRDRNATHMKTKIFQPEIVVKGQEKVRLKALMFLSKI